MTRGFGEQVQERTGRAYRMYEDLAQLLEHLRARRHRHLCCPRSATDDVTLATIAARLERLGGELNDLRRLDADAFLPPAARLVAGDGQALKAPEALLRAALELDRLVLAELVPRPRSDVEAPLATLRTALVEFLDTGPFRATMMSAGWRAIGESSIEVDVALDQILPRAVRRDFWEGVREAKDQDRGL